MCPNEGTPKVTTAQGWDEPDYTVAPHSSRCLSVSAKPPTVSVQTSTLRPAQGGEVLWSSVRARGFVFS